MIKTHKNSHSNIHRHSSEYHDGDNVTHYLGNDDYRAPSKQDEESEEVGKIAFGNELEITDEEDRD